MKTLPDIVIKAYNQGITNIGQLSKKEISQLNLAVRKGILSKFTDYNYPNPKTYYVMNMEDYYKKMSNEENK